jgi:hypothetical protein
MTTQIVAAVVSFSAIGIASDATKHKSEGLMSVAITLWVCSVVLFVWPQ